MSFKKNSAITGFTFGLVSSTDGSDVTTGTPVGYYTLDGGTQTAIGDVTPVHENNGQWSVDLLAAEMNGDIVGLVFTHASAITVHFTIKTDTKIVSELNDVLGPTVAAFEARTILAASYFDPTTDAVATVTTLTNLPAITTNWLTATGIAASAMDGKGDWNIGKTGYTLTQSFPANFSSLGIAVDGDLSGNVDGSVGSVTAQVSADITAISGDTVAADNLELQYDGTGLAGDTFPATQAAVGSLATGTAAISVGAASATITIGTETLTYAASATLDGVEHEVASVGGAVDFYYEYNVGGNGIASRIDFVGRLFSSDDAVEVHAYNWAGASWDQIGDVEGKNPSTNDPGGFNLLTRNTGTGADVGKVRIRAYAASGLTSAVFYVDQAYVSFAVVSQSAGYALGRVWINTVGGEAGVVSYLNGVADNQSLTVADAETIAGNLGISDFHISSDSTFAPAGDFNNKNMYGIGYTATLAGDYAGTHIYHASPLTGTVTTSNNSDHFDALDCIIGNLTVDDAHFTNCGLTGTVTLSGVGSGTPGELKVINCRSLIAGSTTPILDFGTGSENHNVTFSDWQNGIEIQNFNVVTTGGTDLLSMSGTGQLVISANCDGGTINLRGQWKITDNSGGAVTIVQDDVATEITSILTDTTEIGTAGAGLTDLGGMSTAMKAEINAEADTALTDYDGPTNTEMELRTPTAAQLAYITANASTGMPVTFTTSGGSTTAAVLNQVDGSAASATADQYNGRLLVFTDGTLKGVVTDITDYVGSTTTATITAIPFAPESGHAARLI